jgi:hypothetical protein
MAIFVCSTRRCEYDCIITLVVVDDDVADVDDVDVDGVVMASADIAPFAPSLNDDDGDGDGDGDGESS